MEWDLDDKLKSGKTTYNLLSTNHHQLNVYVQPIICIFIFKNLFSPRGGERSSPSYWLFETYDFRFSIDDFEIMLAAME